MKIVIQLTESQEQDALPVLLRHSSGIILPDRRYVIDDDAVKALKDAGVGFTELSRDADAPTNEGVATGERV